MKINLKKLTIEIVTLIAFSLVVPFILYMDVMVLRTDIGEISLTELTQETLLLITAVIFIVGAYKRPAERGFLILTSGAFTCLLTRELDFLFDMVWHGFWLYPALLTSFLATWYALAKRETILPGLLYCVENQAHIYGIIGLIIVLVFSRIFGSGSLLWNHILGANSTHLLKTAVQEGLELYGYLFITYGAFRLLLIPTSYQNATEIAGPEETWARDWGFKPITVITKSSHGAGCANKYDNLI